MREVRPGAGLVAPNSRRRRGLSSCWREDSRGCGHELLCRGGSRGRVFCTSPLAEAVPAGRCGARSTRESSGRSRGARTPARPPCAFLQRRAAPWREPRRPQPPGTPFPPGSTASRGASRSHHAGGRPERSECRSSGLTELRSSRRRAASRARPGGRTRSGWMRAAGVRSSPQEGLGEAVVLGPSPHLQAHSSAERSHLRKSIKRSE